MIPATLTITLFVALVVSLLAAAWPNGRKQLVVSYWASFGVRMIYVCISVYILTLIAQIYAARHREAHATKQPNSETS